MTHPPAALLAQLLARAAHDRRAVRDDLRGSARFAEHPRLAALGRDTAEASVALLSLALYQPRGDTLLLSALLRRMARALDRLLCTPCGLGSSPLLVARIAGGVLLDARVGMALRDCAVLAIVAALRTFPSYLGLALERSGSVAHLTVEANTPALARPIHPLYRAAQSACAAADLVCWTTADPPSWQAVCPLAAALPQEVPHAA